MPPVRGPSASKALVTKAFPSGAIVAVLREAVMENIRPPEAHKPQAAQRAKRERRKAGPGCLRFGVASARASERRERGQPARLSGSTS